LAVGEGTYKLLGDVEGGGTIGVDGSKLHVEVLADTRHSGGSTRVCRGLVGGVKVKGCVKGGPLACWSSTKVNTMAMVGLAVGLAAGLAAGTLGAPVVMLSVL
jgi:hypothetical protein